MTKNQITPPPSLFGCNSGILLPEQTELYVNIKARGLTYSTDEADEVFAVSMGPCSQILFGRLCRAVPAVRVSKSLLAWCSILSFGSPGYAVLWAWTLREISLRNNHRVITVGDWDYHFGAGIPSKAEFQRVWDGQKDEGSNLLDLEALWKTETPAARRPITLIVLRSTERKLEEVTSMHQWTTLKAKSLATADEAVIESVYVQQSLETGIGVQASLGLAFTVFVLWTPDLRNLSLTDEEFSALGCSPTVVFPNCTDLAIYATALSWVEKTDSVLWVEPTFR